MPPDPLQGPATAPCGDHDRDRDTVHIHGADAEVSRGQSERQTDGGANLHRRGRGGVYGILRAHPDRAGQVPHAGGERAVRWTNH